MGKSIDKRLEELEQRTAEKHRPPRVVHLEIEPDLEAWEEQARQNMKNMMRFAKRARQSTQGEGDRSI